MRRKTIEASFFYGAPSEIFKLAKELRKNSTKAEQELWKHLKNKQINGFYFRRQHPIHRFIADFFCYKAKLVIELDGRVHEEITVKERDIEREKIIKEFGIKVIRFSNEEIFNEIDKVLYQIEKAISCKT
ncbi:MAG TPA: endonuclease domain-containing protein [Bacteroidales bacterium]|nr:endonuclease domain-containing protein [Bacteroidales bacterium]HOR82705.1 endonuclease domain-containing protein [Bacteroidales bacterium]HPJ92055.1 endonuclease domain-containing protein [Bacteroidales bacterium]